MMLMLRSVTVAAILCCCAAAANTSLSTPMKGNIARRNNDNCALLKLKPTHASWQTCIDDLDADTLLHTGATVDDASTRHDAMGGKI